MARTRIDPWQDSEPKISWLNTTLSTIIPEAPLYSPPVPSHPTTSYSRSTAKSDNVPAPSPSCHTVMAKPLIYSSLPVPKFPSSFSELQCTLPDISLKTRPSLLNPSKSIPNPLTNSNFNCMSPPLQLSKPKSKPKPMSLYKPKSSHCTSKFREGSATKPSVKWKQTSKVEFECSSSKVKAPFSCHINQQSQKDLSSRITSEIRQEYKPVKRHCLELPNDDKRKNMIPKVVLFDIMRVISKVCPKLSSASPASPNSADDISCLEDWTEPLSPPFSPIASVPSEVSPLERPTSPAFRGFEEPPMVTGEKTPLQPQPTSQPQLVTLERDLPIGSISKTTVPTLSTSIQKSVGVASMPAQRKSLISSPQKAVPSYGKSSTPVSQESTAYEAVGAIAPSLNESSCAIVSSVMQGSSEFTSSYPEESASFFSTSSVLLMDAKKQEAVSSERINALSKDIESSTLSRNTRSSTFVAREFLSNSKDSQNNEPSSSDRRRRKLRSHEGNCSPAATTGVKRSSTRITNGFQGFPIEDGKRLTKTRFHVDTNILASSLDLLDLQKHAEMPSGSPTTCSHCNIIFSSVKHCKYHQSAISAFVVDPARQQNVQDNDVWLCPWCPVMCLTIDYLNTHKKVCREKGRCQQEVKVSSLRKSAPNSSRRRLCTTASGSKVTSASATVMKSTNNFKVVHGIVIPV